MDTTIYQLLLCVPVGFAGALLRGAALRKARFGWILTLLSVLAAAGVWFLWRSDGSMGTGCLYWSSAFALGAMIAEVYALGSGKPRNESEPEEDPQ